MLRRCTLRCEVGVGFGKCAGIGGRELAAIFVQIESAGGKVGGREITGVTMRRVL